MLFYDVEFKSIPEIKYNCAIATAEYSVSLAANDHLLELCYVHSGACVRKDGKEVTLYEEGHLIPIVFSEQSEIYGEGDAPIKMHCLGIECELSVRTLDSDQLTPDEARELMKALLSSNRFLLPSRGLSSIQCEWLLPYVKKIAACDRGDRIGEQSRAISLIFELLSRITKSSMDALAYDTKAFPTSAVAYSEMVVAYIMKNYRKKISVIDIAKEFGLTPNYLHSIFKEVKGTTIIDYLTSYRMNLAKIYIERFGFRAYEAAQMVGIDDPTYFSRVFKKLYGKSVSEFKRK